MPGKRVDKVVERINALDADIILIAGDFAAGQLERVNQRDGFNKNLDYGLASLAELKSADGAFAVFGSHDTVYGKNYVKSSLEQSDVTLLENTASILDKKNDQSYHAGRDMCIVGLACLLYTSPSPRDATLSRMPSSA